jgi:tetratricopeptide (TPR) repeat protein
MKCVGLCAALLAAAALLSPSGNTAAQGMAAWDFEHGALGANPMDSGASGNAALGNDATGMGVGNPNDLPGRSAPITGLPQSSYNPQIEYAKGFTDLEFGNAQRAQAEFDHALKVDPNNTKILFMLGVAYNEAGDTRKAASTWEKTLKIDPQHIDARREYAVALAKLGRASDAQAQFQVLKARTDVCGASCPQADNLKASIDRVQAALSSAPAATQ